MHGAIRVIRGEPAHGQVDLRATATPINRGRTSDVVYNGVENGDGDAAAFSGSQISSRDKIVLFLGRITMQKGPEYFVRAPRSVCWRRYENVKFLVAGNG